jgi:hypothetical protein
MQGAIRYFRGRLRHFDAAFRQLLEELQRNCPALILSRFFCP